MMTLVNTAHVENNIYISVLWSSMDKCHNLIENVDCICISEDILTRMQAHNSKSILHSINNSSIVDLTDKRV